MFQSAPPHGGRLTGRPINGAFGQSQSAPPHGGRPHAGMFIRSRFLFQSAPPHGGRLGRAGPRFGIGQSVSIRAPARGATHVAVRPLPPAEVSIRAPARGATRPSLPPVSSPSQVSIRAPARGATVARDTADSLEPCTFQSAPPHGGRLATVDGNSCVMRLTRFNPRPRTGGDESAGSGPLSRCRFNPRPRTGGDDRPPLPSEPDGVSIRAAARGATRSRRRRCRLCSAGFNPRPRTGGDLDPRCSP